MNQPAPSAEAMLELLDVLYGSAREPEMHSPHAYRIAARQDRLSRPREMLARLALRLARKEQHDDDCR